MKYTIGVDFGTQSGRSLLVEVETGEIVATAVREYTHGVMDEALPNGKKLPPDWALQHPMDYLEVFYDTVPEVLRQAGVGKDDVIGMAVDFTACTILPAKADGTPLCFLDEWKDEPHSYVKLWKHHAAQQDANRLNETAASLGEKWLERYGGKISSEWMVPKVMQIVREAPEVYDAADRVIEAADWVTWRLTGVETRNSCCAGYKAIWNKREGYPGKALFKALDPKLENFVEEKLSPDIRPQGGKAGELTAEMAQKLGLNAGTAVAIANVDAHVAVPAVGITKEGQLLMIMGTSTCHMVLGTKEQMVPGICGYVEDGILPGFFGFEAGQSCVGDHFEWFVENCVPSEYKAEADERGINIHVLLTEKAAKLRVGESGLLALDWWNGNRSVLVDVDLTGLLIGATLLTRPEEIYRALIEATAYGTNMIVENFEKHGVPVTQLFACGGIAEKNALMMQIYADVTGREIFVSESPQTVALGSAMFGAVAAGKDKGGYDTIFDAAKVMPRVRKEPYRPIDENVRTYKRLYEQYAILHDYFGRGANDVMKTLKAIKAGVR